MKIHRPINLGLAAILCFVLGLSQLQADEIIGNLPGNDLLGSAIRSELSEGGTSKAAGFQMPLGPDYRLDNVLLRLEFLADFNFEGNPNVTLYDDFDGLPNDPLITLDNPTFSGGIK